MPGYDKEKLEKLIDEDIEKKIEKRVLVWSRILFIFGLKYLGLHNSIIDVFFFIPIILLIISIIVKENKKVSNIIFTISIIICVISVAVVYLLNMGLKYKIR